MSQLPPYFSTGEPGSFAMKTLRTRKPAIIERVVEKNGYKGPERDRLLELREEVLSGEIYDPFTGGFVFETMEEGARAVWREQIGIYAGKTWFEIPFYFAETYLYMRILLAVGYYDPGSAGFGRDPYAPFKHEELYGEPGGVGIGKTIARETAEMNDGRERLKALLHYTLWGNRVDPSLFSLAEKSKNALSGDAQGKLIIDHTNRAAELLERASRVDYIMDNAGVELVSDLLTIHRLLERGAEVHLHVKLDPFYVSDATARDVIEAVSAITGSGSGLLAVMGSRLERSLESGELKIHDHHFWNGPLHFPDMPPEVRDEIARSDVAVLKGDINYRRLTSDRMWAVDSSLDRIAEYFPVSLVTLRTMKSDSVVDVDNDTRKALDRLDPEWKVNGDRGLVRVVIR